MARGFVRKRGEVWYAYWRDQSGKQRSKAIGSRKKDAEAYLDTVQAKVHAGTYRHIEDVTFAAFAEQWLRDYAAISVKASTLATYTGRVNGSLMQAFGDRKLSTIGTADIQRFLSKQSGAGLSPATLRAYLVLMHNMFEHAVRWDYLAQNPTIGIKPPRLPHREMDFLTPDEVRAFLLAAEPQHYALLATAVMTGMRQGELLALQWDDLNWHAGTIRVRRSLFRGEFVSPKSERSIRNIGMSNRLAAILLEHKMQAPYSPFDLVFPSSDGTPLDCANLRNRVFEPTLRRAGLRRIRFHDLRHTFASILIHQGENPKYVQSQLGHSSIKTTVDRYGHLMPESHRGASERLDGTLFGDTVQILDDKMLPSVPEKQQARSSVSL